MATKPWDMPVSGSMFGGAAPTPVYTPTPYGGYGPSAQEIQDAMRSGTYFAPDDSPNPLGPGSNISEPVSGTGTDWLGKGLEALNKALAYKGQTGSGSSSSSRDYRGYGSNASQVARGRGYTMYMPGATQKTTQSGGSRGIGGALGTIAGIGVSMIPGVGAAAAAAAPALGGQLGSLFG
jgi:hypothetical protein